MELLTEELLQEFRYPRGPATWYATKYEEDRLFFGFVSLFNDPSCDELVISL